MNGGEEGPWRVEVQITIQKSASEGGKQYSAWLVPMSKFIHHKLFTQHRGMAIFSLESNKQQIFLTKQMCHFENTQKKTCSSKTWLERDTATRTFSAVLSPQKGVDSMYHFFEPYWLVQRNHENSASAISKGSTIESRNLDNKGSFFQAWLQRVRLYQQCFRLKWYGQCLIIMSHPGRFIQQHRVRLHHILPLERQGRTCVRVRICQWDEGNKDQRDEPRHHSSIATMQLSRIMMKFHSTANSNPWRKRHPTTCTTCCKNKQE
jgi:hypothetical protein